MYYKESNKLTRRQSFNIKTLKIITSYLRNKAYILKKSEDFMEILKNPETG